MPSRAESIVSGRHVGFSDTAFGQMLPAVSMYNNAVFGQNARRMDTSNRIDSTTAIVNSGRLPAGYFAGGLSASFVSGFAASLSSGGLERWSLLISLAPTEGS